VGSARETQPPGGAVKRAVVHSLLILGLAGMGWAIQLTEDHFTEISWNAAAKETDVLGAWGWLPSLLGCLCLALCVAASVAATRNRTQALPLLFALPGCCLVLSAVGYATEMNQVMLSLVDEHISARGHRDATEWFTQHTYFLQTLLTRAATWAGLAYAGIVLAAGCVSTTRSKGGGFLRWAWPVMTAVAATGVVLLYAAGYGEVFSSQLRQPGQPAWINLGRNLSDLLTLESIGPLLLPAMAVFLVGCAPCALLGIRPDERDLSDPPSDHLERARAVAGMALLGMGASLGLGILLGASADFLQWDHVGFSCPDRDRGAFILRLGGYREYLACFAARPTSLGLAFLAVGAAGPLLLVSFRRFPRWLLPAALVGTSLLAFLGIRSSVVPVIEAEVRPRCQSGCSGLDRAGAVLLFAPIQTRDQLIGAQDPMLHENANLAFPRFESFHDPFVSLVLQIERAQILVDDELTEPFDNTQRLNSECGPETFERTRVVLEARVEDARAVAARNPYHPFRRRYLVAADRSTPSGALDCLLTIAFDAGLEEPHIVVARPGSQRLPVLRTVELHAYPVLAPAYDSPRWKIQLSLSGSVLTSPDGQTWASSSTDELLRIARAVYPSEDRPRYIWVYRSADLPLQIDLDVRDALTEPGLFKYALSMPLRPQ